MFPRMTCHAVSNTDRLLLATPYGDGEGLVVGGVGISGESTSTECPVCGRRWEGNGMREVNALVNRCPTLRAV